jgi:hypothetical protein
MAASAALCAFTWPGLRSFTGAGRWSFHLALLFAASFVTGIGIAGLLNESAGSYFISLMVLICPAIAFARPGHFNIAVLAVLALALNVLLIVGVGKALIPNNDLTAILSGVVLVGGALLSTTAWALISLNKQHGKQGGAQ